jgi:sugar O-acyltransferase (sialic acid O-acetyltransferase NeuD family)
MSKSKKLILFGVGDLAQIAKGYFERDTEYQPVCFTVDREYIKQEELLGLPVVPYDILPRHYHPAEHEAHVCLVYNDMNRCRADICKRMEDDGYKLASYVSPHAFVAPSAKLGKHHFIFENNVIQDFVEIGNNCILWSGNHAGHSSRIGNNVFVSSHVVISGWCDIGDNCFLGVNSTLANNASVGKETWVMHGAILNGTVPSNSMVRTVPSEVMPLNEQALSRALDRARR